MDSSMSFLQPSSAHPTAAQMREPAHGSCFSAETVAPRSHYRGWAGEESDERGVSVYFANSISSVGRLSSERLEGGAQGIGERQCWVQEESQPATPGLC